MHALSGIHMNPAIINTYGLGPLPAVTNNGDYRHGQFCIDNKVTPTDRGLQVGAPKALIDLPDNFSQKLIWLDASQYRYRGNPEYTGFIMGVLLLQGTCGFDELQQSWAAHKDTIRWIVVNDMFDQCDRLFPKDGMSSIILEELSFKEGRLRTSHTFSLFHCSSRAELEERLQITPTDNKLVLALKAQADYKERDNKAMLALQLRSAEIAAPYDDFLKQHLEHLFISTQRRLKLTLNRTERVESDCLCYPELENIKINANYAAGLSSSFEVRRDGEQEFSVSIDNRLRLQDLRIVRGALCMALSQIAAALTSSRPATLIELQIDAYLRGFPRDIVAWATYATSNISNYKGLSPGQFTALIRQSETLRSDNIYNDDLRNVDGVVPRN